VYETSQIYSRLPAVSRGGACPSRPRREGAKLLAGGQSLVPLLNLRMAHVSALIDVNRLAELSFMKRENGTLRVGALTRHRQVEISAEAHAAQPLLPRAAVEVGLR
jgi:aerobic carbon-monoxide dehydrogenase medium subunit